jgi:hypothetical protein
MRRSEAAEILCLLYKVQAGLDSLLEQFGEAWKAERQQQAARTRQELNDIIEFLGWQLYMISPN